MMDWSLPYPAQREAVLAKNIVATSQPLAAQAGIEMLRKGGNAIDAAIATAITLTVVEPSANGIGGDAFAIVHDGKKLHGLNGSGRSPALLTPESVDGEIPKVGWLPVTVPGAVSAWVALHERFGSVEFATLFEPAIAYATDGFLVSRQTAAGWKRGADRYNHLQSWCDTFLIDGKTPQVGQLMKLPDHATTLNEIAASKGESFYSGDLANQIDAASQDGGGLIRADDLASHTCVWVDPLSIDVGSAAFYELPPNGQ
ncbi:MAG TPA: gamma-glutamyltransferase, partial [Phycisphaerales bacterium]|nr:gamma-glutamyltransferase [Phycisphaerales bacterium]